MKSSWRRKAAGSSRASATSSAASPSRGWGPKNRAVPHRPYQLVEGSNVPLLPVTERRLVGRETPPPAWVFPLRGGDARHGGIPIRLPPLLRAYPAELACEPHELVLCIGLDAATPSSLIS